MLLVIAGFSVRSKDCFAAGSNELDVKNELLLIDSASLRLRIAASRSPLFN